ncbi:Polyphosphoinositide phosphatase [Sphaceloma murrayae]|uniref:Polyphosphoinositide phosphatase n=1 Tax=Sphaceloma murrayae TaxID=2082308 RepID=A0A2K1QSI3_9PEZI|nr:Polyphosphoinositide phosphatase [Sphaceloma murrayae]
MPKKHKPIFNNKGTANYVHPSLGSSKPAASDSPPPPATVNERLRQLRREQASAETKQKQIELASSSSQPSVPPSLGGILGVPESAPPPPQPGTRPRTRLRTPGPAPPRSWLTGGHGTYHDSVTRSARRFGNSKCVSRLRPNGLHGFQKAVGEPTISDRSLLHHALKSIARSWALIDDEGLRYLSECPSHIRTALVSYIACFGPEDGVSPRALEMLLDSADPIKCLDLTCLAGWSVSLKALVGMLHRKTSPRNSVSEERESWDSGSSSSEASISGLTLRTPVVITKLSLAHPPPSVLWNDLMNLTTHLPTLTHLSLAQWPFPTKTPGLATATTTNSMGQTFAATGTSMYAMLDGDLVEARALLRLFSRSTYCLKYLDLTGCDWIRALLPNREAAPSRGLYHRSGIDSADSWSDTPQSISSGPDWLGSWKGISYLRIAQVQQPDVLPLVTGFDFSTSHPARGPSMDASFVRRDVLTYLTEHHGSPGAANFAKRRPPPGVGCGSTARGLGLEWRPSESRHKPCNACGELIGSLEGMIGKKCNVCEAWHGNAKRVFDDWIEKEVHLRDFARGIKAVRKQGNGPGLAVDLGWMTL